MRLRQRLRFLLNTIRGLGNTSAGGRGIDSGGEQSQNDGPLSARLLGAALGVLERGRKMMAMKMRDMVMRADGLAVCRERFWLDGADRWLAGPKGGSTSLGGQA